MKLIMYLILWPFILIGYILRVILFPTNEIKSNNKQSYYDTLLDDDLIKVFKRDGKLRKSSGRHFVIITSHGGACPICQKWENKILIDDIYSGGTKKDGKHELLSEAIAAGLFHKGCRHGLATYYPELDDIENYTDEEYEKDLDYIRNYIKNIK